MFVRVLQLYNIAVHTLLFRPKSAHLKVGLHQLSFLLYLMYAVLLPSSSELCRV